MEVFKIFFYCKRPSACKYDVLKHVTATCWCVPFDLCNLYVRTLMEYSSVVWSSDLKRDIEAIEKVQRRCTKRLAGLKKLGLSYGQRLKLVNLPSLELRRLHTDLLWC